jgi:predicted anti-sigma-YlaC factor YlaD
VELDCIDPGAVHDWELEACADGEAPPHVFEHLERCPACRARVREHAALERLLRQALYRFDCPSPDLLRDYHWRYLPTDERRRVEAHLETCPHCTEELADLADLMTAERAQPSQTLLDQARQAAARVRLAVAQLVSPGLSPETAVRLDVRSAMALRGDTQEMLLFDAEGVMVSVNLEQEHTGAYTLFGQVLLPEPAVVAGGHVRLTAREEGMAPAQAVLDANGGFTLPDLCPGVYQLVVCLPDRRIVVPTLALKAEP